MTIKVKAEGLVIPKELLDGVEEFEVRRRDGSGVIAIPADEAARGLHSDEGTTRGRSISERLGSDPIDGGPPDASVVPEAKTDPIWRWGQDPVDGCEPDASVNFDRYRYGAGM